jgi:hypothetical protein
MVETKLGQDPAYRTERMREITVAARQGHPMSDRSTPVVDERETPAARRSLWPWFVTGFAIVFIAMSVGVRAYSMLPSGRGLVACPLWRYYVIAAQRALDSSGALGPASGSSLAAIVTALQHVLCSSVGGAGLVGIGWAVHRLKGRRRNAA